MKKVAVGNFFPKENINKRSFYFKGLFALFLCLILVSIFVFGASFTGKNSIIESINNRRDEIKIHNQTTAFEVIKSEIVGDELHLSLKNISNKGIIAFHALVGPEKGNGVGSYVEFTYSDIKDEISPNEVFVHREPLVKEIYRNGVTLQAVFFTDGTADGKADVIREVNETRRGTKAQLLKALELIQETLSSPQSEFSSRVTGLKAKISDLPTADKTKSSQFNSGLNNAKGNVLLEIKSIQNFKEDLIRIETKLKRVIFKFPPAFDTET